MAEPSSARRTQTESDLTESEVAAAHQLMQLSDDDSNKIRSRSLYEDEEEVDEILSDVTSAKIREIFGKDEFFRPKKQRRYRSLASLYMDTRPINSGNRKMGRACRQDPIWVSSTNRSEEDTRLPSLNQSVTSTK